MRLTTRSVFYYATAISGLNKFINFDEGGGQLSAVLAIGEYTHKQLEAIVENAMNSAGADTYTVTFDRDTRGYTIASTGTFSLLLTTGTQIGTSAHGLLGFTGADTASAASHTSNTTSGSEFKPQFILQDYIPTTDIEEPVEVSVNTSAAGEIEVVKFGTQQFAEMSIMFQTNVDQGASGPIENDANGVSNFRQFMQFATTKGPLEFMPDRGARANFENLILDKTPTNSQGVGFKLQNMFISGFDGYYQIKGLRWLKVT